MKLIQIKKIIYPAIFGAFIIIVAVVFIWTAGFLSKAINKSLFINEQTVESLSIKLDLDNFKLAAEKLGIEIKQESGVENQPPATTTITATTTTSALDKSAIKIAVYNSANTKGLAIELKNLLETGGFKVEKTGNFSPAAETTVIKIKQSKKNYSPLVKEIVSQKYQLAEDQTLKESDVYDIIIIIGNR